jgi:hypothetical protein
LDSTSALVMLLSALTSASMFGYKVSTLAVIKYSLEVQSMVDEERAALIADLDRALLDPNDPHLSAGQRRQLSVMVSDVFMRHPAPRVSISDPNRPAAPEIDRSSDQPHHQVRSASPSNSAHCSLLALVIGTGGSHHQAKRTLTFCAGARLGGSCGPGRLAFCRPVLTCSRFPGHLMPLKVGISRTLRVVFVAYLQALASHVNLDSRVVVASAVARSSESFIVIALRPTRYI